MSSAGFGLRSAVLRVVTGAARFTEWWEGMETTSVGDAEFTLQYVDFPELQIPTASRCGTQGRES